MPTAPKRYKKILYPIDWNGTWKLSEQANNISLPTDDEGNVVGLPVFFVQPNSNPITASGTIGNVGINSPVDGSGNVKVGIESPLDVNGIIKTSLWNAGSEVFVGILGDALSAENGIYVHNQGLLYNGSTWDRQRRNQDQIFTVNDTTITNYTSATIPTYNFRALIIYVNPITITGTSASIGLNAVDPFSGLSFPMTTANNGGVTTTPLTAGTNFAILVTPNFIGYANTTTLYAWNGATGGASQPPMYYGPIPPSFNIAITKTALTVFDCNVSVSGVV